MTKDDEVEDDEVEEEAEDEKVDEIQEKQTVELKPGQNEVMYSDRRGRRKSKRRSRGGRMKIKR